ncbi:MAG: phosphoglycerate mutase family protein [Nocardioides sp.]|nr:phosphoglycerate mutase family protein [Nocardioides sp.]
MTLFLVRHGRPLVDRDRPAAEWELDPAGFDDVWALRESGRLPQRAAWFCSPEPKAVATAQLLTEGDVGIVDDLREHEHPSACRDRVVPAVRRILDVHSGEDVVLVGHGTAWTITVAELTGSAPDLDCWLSLATPDVLVVSI